MRYCTIIFLFINVFGLLTAEIGALEYKHEQEVIVAGFGTKEGAVYFREWPSKNQAIEDFEIDVDNNIWLCDTWNYRIQKYSSNGKYLYCSPLAIS